MIQEAIGRLAAGTSLSEEEAARCVREIVEGKATQAQLGGFLVALRAKGETPGEIASFASTLRGYSVRIKPSISGRLVDTCGTGGDCSRTFNVSTISSFAAAGAGAKVAKHGNRSVTSKCGSADLMERLGFNLAVEPSKVEASIEENGIGFMFAPTFHPAMKAVASVRRELGVRTIFNLIGPLINPAGASCQLIGVYSRSLVPTFAEVLRRLGTEEAMVVHSAEGLDEISASGKTLISTLKGGEVSTREYSPSDFGFKAKEAKTPEVRDVDEAAKIAVRILNGDGETSTAKLMVIANASAALVVAGVAESLAEGAELAGAAIASGAAMKKLREIVKSSGGDASRIEVITNDA